MSRRPAMTGRLLGKSAPAFLKLRRVALHPAHDRRMRHRQAALAHHLHQVSQAQLKAKIPAHAKDDHVAVEVATLEQLFYSLQLGHCRPRLVQHASVADRTVPFAPEPIMARSRRQGRALYEQWVSANVLWPHSPAGGGW